MLDNEIKLINNRLNNLYEKHKIYSKISIISLSPILGVLLMIIILIIMGAFGVDEAPTSMGNVFVILILLIPIGIIIIPIDILCTVTKNNKKSNKCKNELLDIFNNFKVHNIISIIENIVIVDAKDREWTNIDEYITNDIVSLVNKIQTYDYEIDNIKDKLRNLGDEISKLDTTPNYNDLQIYKNYLRNLNIRLDNINYMKFIFRNNVEKISINTLKIKLNDYMYSAEREINSW